MDEKAANFVQALELSGFGFGYRVASVYSGICLVNLQLLRLINV